MMKIFNHLTYTAYLSLLVLLIQSCNIQDIVQEDANEAEIEYQVPDAEGNLYITNELNQSIYLYVSRTLVKEIPLLSTFLINISNQGMSTQLKVWLSSDVTNINEPSEEKIYRLWEVVLSTNTDSDERATWIIKDGEGGLGVGTLFLNYASIGLDDMPVIYSVDVFLHNQEGAKITSLSPGINNKQIGLEYGLYVVLFQYWWSDPNSTEGRQNIGWIDVKEDGNSYIALINADSKQDNINIPVKYGSSIGRVGDIIINNTSDEYVLIYANSSKIEEYIVSDESVESSSYMEPNSIREFSLHEGEYTFLAKDVSHVETIDELIDSRNIIEKYPFHWEIGSSFSSLRIINNTDNSFTIHEQGADYLGYEIDANKTTDIMVPGSANVSLQLTYLRVDGLFWTQ